MRTLLITLGSWTTASILLVLAYAIGAAAGYRRARLHIVPDTSRPAEADSPDHVIRLDELEEHFG